MSSPQPARLDNNLNGVVTSRSTSPASNISGKASSTRVSGSSAARRNTPADSHPNAREISHPLMATERLNPPIANAETDDDNDDREVVHGAYPGVDDGFFTTRANEDGPTTNPPDVETVPRNPTPAGPEIHSVDDDGARSVPPRGHTPRNPTTPHPRHPTVPEFVGSDRPASVFPTYNDLEFGTIAPDLETLPDVNVYQHKKTLAQGMMDLALFSANANQLRYVLDSSTHPYYYSGIILISISLIFQVIVGIGLIWNSRLNIIDDGEIHMADRINNFLLIGIFLVTVINVFISAFGVVTVDPALTRP